MKTKYIFLLISMLFAFSACGDDSGTNPVFAEDEVPYIYTNYPETMVATAGEPMNYSILVSPADGSVDIKWILDGTVIATTNELQYTIDTPGTYTLRFEVSRNNIKNYREYKLIVS